MERLGSKWKGTRNGTGQIREYENGEKTGEEEERTGGDAWQHPCMIVHIFLIFGAGSSAVYHNRYPAMLHITIHQ